MKKLNLVDFKACEAGIWNWFKRWLSGQPHFVIYTKDQKGVIRPQLLRWWVLPRNILPWNVYLHLVIGSDDLRHLHDHPWPTMSILLFGDLRERRLLATTGNQAITKDYKIPWLRPVFRTAEQAHSLFLGDKNKAAMTLFFMGRKKRKWGFYDADQGFKWVPWDVFVDARDKGKPK